MLLKCDAAARIHCELGQLLSPLCNPSIVMGGTAERKFYWPDKITVAEKSCAEPIAPVVNIQQLRAEQARKQETKQLIAEISGPFKRLHPSKAGLAIHGRKGFHRQVVSLLEKLEEVCYSDHCVENVYC